MKLILEASALLSPLTGIGRYTKELAGGLLEESDVDVQFLVRNRLLRDLSSIKEIKPRTHFPLWSKPFRVANNRWRNYLNRQYFRQSLFHGPNFFVPESVENAIITVHDLSIFLYPETHPIERLRQFERHFERSLKQTRHIITDSEYVRQEIVERFSYPKNQITTVYIGVASAYRPVQIVNQALLERYGLSFGAYTLCVATIEPRKNIDKLLQAYQQLDISLRRQYPLILVGGYGWLSEHIVTAIEEGAAQGWVRKLGFVPESDLIELYQHARLFVYPSAYEGFGLPVLEAMACGVPVVTSNRSSLPEIGGDAVALINPDDIQELKDAIARGLSDALWRERAINQGLLQAQQFSWKKCVKDTLQVYRSMS